MQFLNSMCARLLPVPGRSAWLCIREPCASSAIPVSFNSMASGLLTMLRCNVAEEAAIRPIFQQMASDLDGIASFQVFALNANAEKPAEARGLHRPDRRFAFVIFDFFDFHVEPGMGDEIMDFGHLAFHRRPC